MTREGRKGRGCLFYGGIAALVLLVTLLLGALVGLRYAKHLVAELTDTRPMPLPQVRLTRLQLDDLLDRVDTFGEAVREGNPAQPLELTGDEINALIATEPGLEFLRGRLFVSIQGRQLRGEMSFPAEEIGMRPLRGRYLNATGIFSISLTNGQLRIVAESLSIRGKPVPAHLMREIQMQNLAGKVNADPRAHAGLSTLRDIRVENGRLILVPK